MNVYTDGSLIRKNGKIYCGYGIHFSNNEYKNISKSFTKLPITNNRAELYAIYKSLKICNKINHTKKCVSIYSDSEYCIKTFNSWLNNWIKNKKEYKNKDLIDKIKSIIDKKEFEIKFIHILAHTNNKDIHSICNNIADNLAKDGALYKP